MVPQPQSPYALSGPSSPSAPSAPPQPAGSFYGLASGSAAGPRPAPQASREEMKQPVELTLSCNNLINTDTFSKSDPFIVAYEIVGGAEVELDRTEVVMDNLNPQFTKPIRIDFRFEETQNLLFRVYDLDDKNKGLDAQDFLGEARTSLAEIVTQNEITIALKMPDNPARKCGTITLHSEESNGSEDEVMFTIGCKNIPKKKFFGKTDAVLEVCRVISNEGAARVAAAAVNRTTIQPIYRTETVKNVTTCNWKAFGVRMHRLCNGDLHRPLLFRIVHYRSSGNHELVGQVEASLDAIVKGNVTLELKSRSGRNAGTIIFHTARIVTRYSFLDYVRSGFEISLVTAIDFTASNGDPNQSTSLHYRNPQQPNEYLKAIMAVGDIVAHYDKDQRFPVYGFGAKIPPHGQLSHCFPCTFDENRPEVVGVQGILDVYASALNQVTLYGPTYFAPIIQRVAGWARQSKQQYWVLLLLTDGVIVDMQPTIDAIVEASDLPLSIIIVGVGHEDFSKMDILDADDEPLKSSRGQLMKRDIVQFVPFRQFANQPYSKLAQETLREVPDQLVSWAKANQVPPVGRTWQA